jgi:hypothetical protein
MPRSDSDQISHMNDRISLNLLLTDYSHMIIELQESDQPQEMILEEQHSIRTLDKLRKCSIV